MAPLLCASAGPIGKQGQTLPDTGTDHCSFYLMMDFQVLKNWWLPFSKKHLHFLSTTLHDLDPLNIHFPPCLHPPTLSRTYCGWSYQRAVPTFVFIYWFSFWGDSSHSSWLSQIATSSMKPSLDSALVPHPHIQTKASLIIEIFASALSHAPYHHCVCVCVCVFFTRTWAPSGPGLPYSFL